MGEAPAATAKRTRKPRGDSAPNRPQPGAKALTVADKKKLKQELEGGLLALNMLLRRIAPAFVLDDTGMDPLNLKPEGNEIEQVADAMVDEIAANQRMRAFFGKVASASPHLKLISVIGGIVFARVMYWQQLAAERERQAASDGSGEQPGETTPGNTAEAPVFMAPGAAYGGGGNDGLREVHADGETGAVA